MSYITEARNIPWEKVTEMSINLGEQIKEDGFNPDYIIGISRGGYFPAAFINEMLSKWARIGFVDIGRDDFLPDKRIIKGSSFCEETDLRDKKILLCDDINETGLTFIAVKKYLEQRGAKVKILCFFSRPISKIVPDYVVVSEINFEPIFPWEELRNRISF